MVEDETLGVPNGVLALARSLLPGDRVVELLSAPRRLEPDWPEPAEPIPVGQGWVHAEIIDDDQPVFQALLSDARESSSDRSAPEALCAAAQELRLPVSPYRSLPAADRFARVSARCSSGDQPPSAAAGRAIIVDLSTHWAGPLATKLLAEAGATVIKLDPDCRPDGFRSRVELYRHLNGQKEVVDFDLRSPAGRTQLERLVAKADLVVESFSRRVMANLGYGPDSIRRLNPNCSTLSIRAFPANGPEANWVGYGPGVHAASGLGTAVGAPRPASLAYPDFLGGLTAYRRALELIGDPQRPPQAEVSLMGSIAPLVAIAASRACAAGTSTEPITGRT